LRKKIRLIEVPLKGAVAPVSIVNGLIFEKVNGQIEKKNSPNRNAKIPLKVSVAPVSRRHKLVWFNRRIFAEGLQRCN
jgi:hypothetical protein